MIESVIVEMCVSVIDVPPSSAEVVDGEQARDLLVLDERGQADDELAEALQRRDPLQRREAVDRHAVGPELLDLLLHADQVVLQGGGLGIVADDLAAAPRPPSARSRRPSPWRCGRAARGSPRRRRAGSARPPRRRRRGTAVVISVLPVPVGPGDQDDRVAEEPAAAHLVELGVARA